MDSSSTESSEISPNPEENLTEFLQQGFELIRQGRYEEAVEYLHSKSKAREVGFNYTEGILIGVRPNLTEKLAHQLSIEAGAGSFFMHDPKPDIKFATLWARYPIESEEGRKSLQHLWHNVALIHAEEWLHGLQYLLKNPLAGEQDGEIDVAVYLYNNKIPLTSEFLSVHKRSEYPLFSHYHPPVEGIGQETQP